MSSVSSAATTEEDLQAIRRLVAMAEKHQNDPEPFLALHTADVTIVNIAGRRVFGRDELRRAMTAALASPLADVLTTTEIEDVRFIGTDVALVSCLKYVSDERAAKDKRDGAAPLPSKGSLTYVVVRDQDEWRISLAQTTPIRE
jgi:uncharacterized protein (TIGR02246 family)